MVRSYYVPQSSLYAYRSLQKRVDLVITLCLTIRQQALRGSGCKIPMAISAMSILGLVSTSSSFRQAVHFNFESHVIFRFPSAILHYLTVDERRPRLCREFGPYLSDQIYRYCPKAQKILKLQGMLTKHFKKLGSPQRATTSNQTKFRHGVGPICPI
jgi:hypothetical protein